MLHLQYATPASWVDEVEPHIDSILLDHAHCEKKAASTAINLIFRYPEYPQLLRPLSEVAREELSHFELVLDHLDRRKVTFARLAPSPYAGKLMTIVRPQEPARLVDVLLCCAAIEARSCERMQLLAAHLTSPELRQLYEGLLVSEARHHVLYIDLAMSIAPADEVRARVTEVMAHEASVIMSAPGVPRMHNGAS
ncbi:MAG: tRNA-(ms[2]io[6]A)-hydroxylase [Myxococcota bacterium]|nr:tRNA-(ms[2]io[6]A)-hydroxylase [Myxococcota bacterium]